MTILDRKGPTTVMALMVSLFLMLLVTATMTLTIADVELIQDYSRNKKTFQAAQSGIAHGDITLAHALSSFRLNPSTSTEDVDNYADDAESPRIPDSTRDISLLVDTAGPVADGHLDEILARNDVKLTGTTEAADDGLQVGYNVSYDIYPTGVDRADPDDFAHTTVFHYQYDVISEGAADIGGQHNQATRTQRGMFDVQLHRPSFATYGYFTQGMKNQFDHQLVFFDGEVYSGPTHVNSAPPEGRAGFYGQATFNGPFSAVQESYEESWLGGNADPVFNDSVAWGVDPIDLPENGWSQLRASVGDIAHADILAPPSNSELRDLLGLTISNDPVDQGVYYSQNYNQGSSLNGGILVNGSAQYIQLTSTDTEQIIEIQMLPTDDGQFDDGSPRTWTFKENLSSGQTQVFLDGNLQDVFSTNTNGLIHVEGSVAGVKGDGTLAGADIQGDYGLTLSATGNIEVMDHITYQDDPLTNPDADNIFGIFSSNGNIYLDEDAPNDLTLHATVMAASEDHGVGAEGIADGGWYNYNYPDKGNWNLLGGLIENKNQTTGVFYSNGHTTGYTWNFDYDERFAEGLAPPYFPYVTKFIIEMQNLEASNWGRRYY